VISITKPYFNYRFSVHKYGAYHQISPGMNISLFHNRVTLNAAWISKFIRPGVQHYLTLGMGYRVF
jgi:hypothetical protein